MSAFKPFHVSIVGAINNARSATALDALGRLILETEIPEGHDEIIEAYRRKIEARICRGNDDIGVLVSLATRRDELSRKSEAADQPAPDGC